ncbi:MarR family winged helix-turn-helix transcriptional regulator [Geodermatophilus sp. CPCC 206100]|uniref:MarR family winged helix-turn-helix transcriptional regulator n=1 Tax=Geodermatophilus sp. CPCC 206100 TaxID=3020054 RepID=UPI003B008B92
MLSPTDPADLDGSRPSTLYLVKQLEQAVRARLDEVLRPAAITPLQYTALTVLERSADLSTAELARNSFVTDQSAADLIAVLEDRGLLSRVVDPRDRRRRVLRLTERGRELLDRYRDEVDRLESRMVAPLTPVQADDLRRYVVLCRAALDGTARR